MAPLVEKQANVISLLLSHFLKFPIRLVPDPYLPKDSRQVFRFHGQEGHLSEDQRREIILWFMGNHPEFVRLWWCDEYSFVNVIDLNANHELFVHEHHLVTVLMAIYPNTQAIVNQLGGKINSRFSYLSEPYSQRIAKLLGFNQNTKGHPLISQIRTTWQFIHLQGSGCDDNLIHALRSLVKKKLNQEVYLALSTMALNTAHSVYCLNPESMFNFDAEPNHFEKHSAITAEKAKELGFIGKIETNTTFHQHHHRGMNFIIQMNPITLVKSIVTPPTDLNHLLKALDLPEYDLLPTLSQPDTRDPSHVHVHPGMTKTNFYILYMDESNGNGTRNLLTPIDTAGEPTWVTELREGNLDRVIRPTL